MLKKSIVLVGCIVVLGSVANAGVILNTQTTADTPESGYNTTIVRAVSDGTAIKGIKGSFETSLDFSQVHNYGWQSLIPTGGYANYVDVDKDTHFLFEKAQIDDNGLSETYRKIYADFVIQDSSAVSNEIVLAQIVTDKDSPVGYTFTFTDVSGSTHDLTGSFVTPEPATMTVLVLGGLGLAVRRRR
jgi:hypothetical protein